MSGQFTEFALVEADKENIQPVPQGRSVQKLAEMAHMDKNELESRLEIEKQQYEAQLDPDRVADLDDPLEPYLEYLGWIRESYPSGNKTELIQLLERTTHDFKDDEYYKNEVRYFRIWLEYIKFSDTPREIFTYLHKKRIGCKLSLFYEQYSLFLEQQNEYHQADEIYRKGIEANARPLPKLLRAYEQFKARKDLYESEKHPISKGLSNDTGGGLGANQQRSSRQRKFTVFSDAAASTSSTLDSPDRDSLGSFHTDRKENVMPAVPFKGQTIPQVNTGTKRTREFDVFNDVTTKYPVTKTIDVPGKRAERYDFNFDLFLVDDEPRTIHEVLALMRASKSRTPKRRKESLVESPTLTFFSKQASKEVMQMFNNPVNTTINSVADGSLSDFVTETITKTPKKSEPDGDTMLSSPFLDTPLRISFHKPTEVDPYSVEMKAKVLDLVQGPDYHRLEKAMNKLDTLESLFKPGKPQIMGNCQSLLQFGDGLYCVTQRLQQNVFLCEKDTGEQYSLKVSNDNYWEFYMLKQLGHDVQLYQFSDESYLITRYYKQGDLVRLASIAYKFEQPLAAHLVMQLVKQVNELHTLGYIHGNILPVNCMIDLEENRRLVITDYSQAVDLSLYDSDVLFKTDSAWRYERDYIALANTIHWLIFGSFIDGPVIMDPRWDTKWGALFDELLHSKEQTIATDLSTLSKEDGIDRLCELLVLEPKRH